MADFIIAGIALEVDQRQAQKSLKQAEEAVKKSVKKMQQTFKKLSQTFTSVFRSMVRIAKWAGAGITAAFVLVTRAAIKQEDAVFALRASLEATGDATFTATKQFEDFAAAVQRSTIYGDEQVLQLIALQKNLGVSTDQLEKATRMAIGLAAATNRNVESMSQYVALALQGEFTMLRRYIPALRKTTDQTEQLRIVQEFAANGFRIAQARAETTGGALRQLWNVIGDTAERIGEAFLPSIRRAAIALKEWLIDNEQRFVDFGRKVAKIMDEVILRIRAFIGVVSDRTGQEGFGAGLIEAFKILFDVLKTGFLAFAESLGVILVPIFRKLGEVITDALLPGDQSGVGILIKEYERLEGVMDNIRDTMIKIEHPEWFDMEEIYPEPQKTEMLYKIAQRLIEVENAMAGVVSEIERLNTVDFEGLGIFDQIGNIYARRFAEISTRFPDLAKKMEQLRGPQEPMGAGIERARQQIKESWDGIIRIYKQGVRTLQSIVDMTRVPSPAASIMDEERMAQEANFEERMRMIEEYYKEQTRLAQEAADKEIKFIRDAIDKTRYERKLYLEEWVKDNQEAADIIAEELERIDRSRINQLTALQTELRENWQETVLYMSEVFADFARGIETSMSDAFYDMGIGAKNFGDAMKDLANNILRNFMKMASDLAANFIMNQLFGMAAGTLTGQFFGLQPAPAPTTAHQGIPRLHGGLAADEFPAILQRGESVIPKGKSPEPDISINIINQSSKDLEATEGPAQFNGDNWVKNIILKDQQNMGILTRSGAIGRRR